MLKVSTLHDRVTHSMACDHARGLHWVENLQILQGAGGAHGCSQGIVPRPTPTSQKGLCLGLSRLEVTPGRSLQGFGWNSGNQEQALALVLLGDSATTCFLSRGFGRQWNYP